MARILLLCGGYIGRTSRLESSCALSASWRRNGVGTSFAGYPTVVLLVMTYVRDYDLSTSKLHSGKPALFTSMYASAFVSCLFSPCSEAIMKFYFFYSCREPRSGRECQKAATLVRTFSTAMGRFELWDRFRSEKYLKSGLSSLRITSTH